MNVIVAVGDSIDRLMDAVPLVLYRSDGDPVAPVIPIIPVVPVVPFIPVGPVGPVVPVGPVGPCFPGAPSRFMDQLEVVGGEVPTCVLGRENVILFKIGS